ncbi:hypothetical protein C0993_005108 [Termitomyces sp. T159_Od127]|nr:hypothetical protein C0993_005108 [Termitomyces sp. T159_Od127]
MHSNLQRAVADVLAANQEVKFATVLTAYIRVAGFKKSDMDVLMTFERAMDKHPDYTIIGGPCSIGVGNSAAVPAALTLLSSTLMIQINLRKRS